MFTREKDQNDNIEGIQYPNYGLIGIISIG